MENDFAKARQSQSSSGRCDKQRLASHIYLHLFTLICAYLRLFALNEEKICGIRADQTVGDVGVEGRKYGDSQDACPSFFMRRNLPMACLYFLAAEVLLQIDMITEHPALPRKWSQRQRTGPKPAPAARPDWRRYNPPSEAAAVVAGCPSLFVANTATESRARRFFRARFKTRNGPVPRFDMGFRSGPRIGSRKWQVIGNIRLAKIVLSGYGFSL